MQIVYALTDVINLLYKKFTENASEINAQTASSIKKIDSKFVFHVLKVISKDVQSLTEGILKSNLSKVDVLLTSIENSFYDKPIPKDAFLRETKKRSKSATMSRSKSLVQEEIEKK